MLRVLIFESLGVGTAACVLAKKFLNLQSRTAKVSRVRVKSGYAEKRTRRFDELFEVFVISSPEIAPARVQKDVEIFEKNSLSGETWISAEFGESDI